MGLDLRKLEKVVELADGGARARCPACAEQGHDRKGEHLRIYPDGRFGCCAHQGEGEHRKRIYCLAGERARRDIQVRVSAAKTGGPIQCGILGRLARLFPSPEKNPTIRPASDGRNELQTGCTETAPSGTPGTGSNNSSVHVETVPSEEGVDGCPRIGFGRGVPGVPERGGSAPPPEVAGGPSDRLPYLGPSGTLIIPFDSPERYHWWKPDGPRQSLAETRAELLRRTAEEHGKDEHGTAS